MCEVAKVQDELAAQRFVEVIVRAELLPGCGRERGRHVGPFASAEAQWVARQQPGDEEVQDHDADSEQQIPDQHAQEAGEHGRGSGLDQRELVVRERHPVHEATRSFHRCEDHGIVDPVEAAVVEHDRRQLLG